MKGILCGSYRLVSLLGTGGLSEVWIGEDQVIGQRVAIKLLKPEVSSQQANVDRILKEACSVSALNHPGIIKIFSFGLSDPGERPYLAMELLDGESLNERLTPPEEQAGTRSLSISMTIRLTRQLASAMGTAHDRGILHRDLKPDNLFLVPDSEVVGGERIKVLDFGLAKLNDSKFDRTSPNLCFGTPAYMAPEQYRDASSVDNRADLYSMGCIMYRCLCGRPPFGSGDIATLMNAHMNKAPVPPRRLRPDVPADLEVVILRLLAKAPSERLQSCDQLLTVLNHIDRRRTSSPGIDSGALKTTVFTPKRSVPLPGVTMTIDTDMEEEMEALAQADVDTSDDGRDGRLVGNVESDGIPLHLASGQSQDTERMVDDHLRPFVQPGSDTDKTSDSSPPRQAERNTFADPAPVSSQSGHGKPRPSTVDPARPSVPLRPSQTLPRSRPTTSSEHQHWPRTQSSSSSEHLPPRAPKSPLVGPETRPTGAALFLPAPQPPASASSRPRVGPMTSSSPLVSAAAPARPLPPLPGTPMYIQPHRDTPSVPPQTASARFTPSAFPPGHGHITHGQYAYLGIANSRARTRPPALGRASSGLRLWLLSGAIALLTILIFALALLWLRSDSSVSDASKGPDGRVERTSPRAARASRDTLIRAIADAYLADAHARSTSLCATFHDAGHRDTNTDARCARVGCITASPAMVQRHLRGVADRQFRDVSESCARHDITIAPQ